MTDGDYYASYQNVRDLLMNQGLGVAGDVVFNDSAIEIALDVTMAEIHLELYQSDTNTKVTGTSYVKVFKGMQISLIFNMILRSRHLQRNNLTSGGENMQFWQMSPELTKKMIAKIKKIREQLADQGMIFDINSTEQIYP